MKSDRAQVLEHNGGESCKYSGMETLLPLIHLADFFIDAVVPEIR